MQGLKGVDVFDTLKIALQVDCTLCNLQQIWYGYSDRYADVNDCKNTSLVVTNTMQTQGIALSINLIITFTDSLCNIQSSEQE